MIKKRFFKLHSGFLLPLFLSILFYNSFITAGTPYIISEGCGYNREQAVHSALRAAVEKNMGVFIESQTKIENYKLISDKILSRTKGYVSHYEVVAGSERTEFGLIVLKIKAVVKATALREDLEAINLIYSMKNLPRIMVFIKEHAPGLTLTQRTTATVLESELLSKGFRLVDRERTEKIKDMDIARFSNNSFAAKIGFRLGADLLITGSAEAGEALEETVYSIKQWRAPCQTNLRLIRTDNAQLISAVSLSNDWASRSRMQAMNSSLKKNAKKASKQIIDDMISFWKEEIYNTSIVELFVIGINNSEISSLTGKILETGIVKNATLRYLEGDNAVFDVEISGTIQNLREAFSKMNDIAVNAMTSNRIDISKIAQEEEKPEIKFKVTEPDIAIVKASFDPVFPCIYAWYAQHNAGNVLIKNNTQSAVSDATVSVAVPHYTALPTNTEIPSIPTGVNTPFEFKLTLDTKAVTGLSERIHTQADVSIGYMFRGNLEKRQLTVPITIESINAIQWADPAMAASFVTPNNTIIKRLARQTLRAVSYNRDEHIISELAYTAAIYYTLKSLGIIYVKDPHSAIGHDITDNINYPVQTLELKSGDCDDTSILFASFLESIGIETALILYPDHVLVMFNTDIYEKNAIRVSYDKRDYILHNNKIWIPVETSCLQTHSFIEAWHSAMKEFSRAVTENENVSFVDIHSAWKKYPSFDPFQQEELELQPDINRVNEAFTKDIVNLKNKLRKDFIIAAKALLNEIKADSTASGFNRLGILFVRNGNLPKAELFFKRACKKDASFSPAQNNLANIYCLKGIDTLSINTYNKAISLNPQNGQYYINKGLCFLTRNEIDACLESIRFGIAKLDRPEAAEEILGIDLLKSAIPLKGGEKKKPLKKEVSKTRIKNLIKKVMDKVPDKEIKGYSKNILPVGGLRGADPEQIEKIADLLWWAE